MRKSAPDALWAWLLSAVVFFALVIAYFLGGRVLGGSRRRAPALPAPLPADAPEPAGSPLPTAAVRMKIKRIEPRKYRREVDLPPPSVR